MSILTKHLPAHWDSFRIGSVFVERTEKVSDEDYAPLSVTMKGVVPRLENVAKTTNGENRKRVCINDFVINSRSDRKGSGGMSKYDGSVSLINTVLKPNTKYDNRYTNYLLTNVLFQEEFYKFGKGIVDDMWSTKYFDMKYIKVPCPPLEEQIAIANYLDEQSKKIKHFIQKKQAFIDLLKEQRQAFISKAVTKGINPEVTLKDSGIQWLGDSPEHWEIKRLKNCGTFQSGENLTSEVIDDTSDYPVYGGNGLRGYYHRYNHDGEYVLIGRQGALCGNINYGSGKFWATEHAVVVTLNEKINHFWFGETLRVMNLNQYSQSSAQPGIAVENIRPLKLPFPPLEEQTQIVSFIKTETAKIDQAIAKAEKEIELIKEYREAMIAEAVLGKLDVKVHTKKVWENG